MRFGSARSMPTRDGVPTCRRTTLTEAAHFLVPWHTRPGVGGGALGDPPGVLNGKEAISWPPATLGGKGCARSWAPGAPSGVELQAYTPASLNKASLRGRQFAALSGCPFKRSSSVFGRRSSHAKLQDL